MPYQANASALLACVFISLLKNLALGAAIDYAATLKPTRFFVHRGQRWNARQSNIKQRFCSSTCIRYSFPYKLVKINFQIYVLLVTVYLDILLRLR